MEVAMLSGLLAAKQDTWDASIRSLMQVPAHHGMLQASQIELGAQIEARRDLEVPCVIDGYRLETFTTHRFVPGAEDDFKLSGRDPPYLLPS